MADSHKIYSHLQEIFIEIFWLLWYNVTKRSRAQFDDLRTHQRASLWYNVTKRSRAQFDDLRTQRVLHCGIMSSNEAERSLMTCARISVLHCDVLKISISSTIPLCCMAGIKETVFSGLSFLQWQSKEQFPIK